MLKLTQDNYYSIEADREYMSCSQYDGWLECEAKQLAKIQGRWTDNPCEAFLVGNFFHSYFEGAEAHEKFKQENFNSIFKTKTTKDKKTGIETVVITGMYAPYEKALQMIGVAEKDELIKALIQMPGENEMIMSGKLFGIVPWRIKLDKYVADGRLIIDWKTCASITEMQWNSERREHETFIDTYGYMRRAAIYSEIEKQFSRQEKDPHFIIVAISKQDPPDKEVLELNHKQRYEYELSIVQDKLGRILAVKEGRQLPRRCGHCDYCRATKKLTEIKPYYKLMPEYREMEEDYATGQSVDNA
jgi:hypothetical protein